MRGSRLVKTVQSIFKKLTATHAVSAVQTFITGSATDRDMTAGITGRRITLHAFSCCIYCIQSGFCIYIFYCLLLPVPDLPVKPKV